METGRPSLYSQELAQKICESLSNGHSLVAIAKMEWSPSYTTMRTWIKENPEFEKMYENAKIDQAEHYADLIKDVAFDDSRDFVARMVEREDGTGEVKVIINKDNVQRARLKVDSLKWISSKLLPKKYGDHSTVELIGSFADSLKEARERESGRQGNS